MTNSLRLRQGIVNGELYWSTVYNSSAASRPSAFNTSANFERWRSISSGVATPGNGSATTVRAGRSPIVTLSSVGAGGASASAFGRTNAMAPSTISTGMVMAMAFSSEFLPNK